MRKLLLVISVLIILSAILFAKPYEQYPAALTENKAEVENVFQGTITENGVGNSYKFLQKNNTEKMLELSAGSADKAGIKVGQSVTFAVEDLK